MSTPGTGAPPPPDVARGVFGDRLEVAVAYADLLATDGVERGLIGPREAPRLWERHLLNCAVLSELVPTGAELLDVGTGAGLPGVVLAVVRPDLRVTLVEPLARRTAFLEDVCRSLALPHVRVVRARAEELSGVRADVVTSRAVAPLPRLLGWSLPLCRVGGSVLALKGSSAADEVVAVHPSGWSRSGAAHPEVLTVGVGVVDPPSTVVRVVRERETRVRLSVRSAH